MDKASIVIWLVASIIAMFIAWQIVPHQEFSDLWNFLLCAGIGAALLNILIGLIYFKLLGNDDK
jgi:hypothetical protein